MAAFASASDMTARYDVRTLGDLCSDDGTPVEKGDLSSSTIMDAALDDATGEILANLLRGGRYEASDLTGLTGESQSYLKHITCKLAFWKLWDRKPYTDDQQHQQARQDAREILELLRTGQEIFDVDRVVEAGKPQVETISETTIHGEWELVVDRARGGRFYPRRRTFRDR